MGRQGRPAGPDLEAGGITVARLRTKVLASAAATAGMAALPAGYAALEAYGPASRVAVYPYLPVQAALTGAAALVLGAWLGGEAHRLLWPGGGVSSALRLAVGNLLGGAAGLTAAVGLALLSSHALGTTAPGLAALALAGLVAFAACAGGALLFRAIPPPRRWTLGLAAKLLALGLLAGWALVPQLQAFPAGGALAERDAWARAHVPAYPALVHVVGELPEVLADVGSVEGIAPTGADRHASAVGMNGDDLRFTLEVAGSRGTGTFLVDCTLADGMVLDWREGRWTFGGVAVPVRSVPASLRLPR
jgi:hypothetical protein